ncbi:hypothetical protein [Paraburkholderia sediminicola]|uniref:hypothetical protein n=1 Tax=Paraburkholderia sediminicola TaxID=458836 RepID=UPI0038BA9845
MKKILFSLMLSLVYISALAASSLPPVPFPIPGNLGGTGDTIYLNPVMNNAGAATANTTLINNALLAGGEVKIDCPAANPVFYTNGVATIYSNTHLTVPKNCVWTQANNTNTNMLVSHAYSESWNTLWNGTGTAAGGLYSLVNAPAANWTGTTAYAIGAVTSNSGLLYWQASGAACTSGSSGGPTGTGTAITDGTCSWNYVTATPGQWSAVNYSNRSYYVMVHWPSHGLSAGQFLWINGQPDTTSSNAWTGTQAAGQRGGLADSAYFGVFPIVAVNDANNVTIKLRRLPATNFTGIPIWAKVADQNITVDGGGTFNYNAANNSSQTTTQQDHTIIFAGIYNLQAHDLVGINSYKYFMDTAGLNTADIGNIMGGSYWTTGTANGDQIKVYGPAFDVTVHDSGGNGWDDSLSFQPQEPSSHYDQVIAAGDIINVSAKNMRGYGGYAVSLWPTHPYMQMDNILLDNIAIVNNTVNIPSIRISGAVGLMGDLTIQHCKDLNSLNPLIQIVPGAGFTLDTLRTRDNDVESTANGGFLNISLSATASATINHIISDGDRYVAAASTAPTGAMFSISNTSGGTLSLGDLLISNAYVTSTATRAGYVFNAGSVTTGLTFGRISIDHSYMNSLNFGIWSNVAANYAITNSIYSNGHALFDSTAAATLQLTNNQVNFGNVIQYDAGAAGITLYSSNNVVNGSGNWFFYSGSTPSTTVYGADIQCDVTKMNRVSGEYCFNTNTAPGSGTLTTSGPVMDQGTTSGSWFLQSNPTGQTY